MMVFAESVLASVKGGSQPGFRPYIHGEHTAFGASAHYVTDGREKYVWLGWSGAEQLFDLREDPQEMRDLSMVTPQRTAHWREILVRELADRSEGLARDGKLVAHVNVPPVMEHVIRKA